MFDDNNKDPLADKTNPTEPVTPTSGIGTASTPGTDATSNPVVQPEPSSPTPPPISQPEPVQPVVSQPSTGGTPVAGKPIVKPEASVSEGGLPGQEKTKEGTGGQTA